jgi:hypothetical protein
MDKVRYETVFTRNCTHQVSDPCRNQPLHVLAPLVRVDDVNSLVTILESVLNKRKQHAVFFLVAVEECTNMTRFCEL